MRYLIFYYLTKIIYSVERGLNCDKLEDIEHYLQCDKLGVDCIIEDKKIKSILEII